MITVYGIKNCDTVKKALLWLEKNKINYDFVDFKKTPPTVDQIVSWKKDLGVLPVNPKGRTYKALETEYQNASEQKKMDLMIEQTSLIKRPLVTIKNKCVFIGFDEVEFKKIFL